MKLEDSPTFNDEFEWNGETEYEEPTPPKGRKLAWIIIVLLLVLGVTLGVFNILQTDVAAGLVGKGTLTGHAVNEAGQPVVVDVFVVGYPMEAQSDSDGNFRLDGLPAGEQVVVIGYQGMGYELPVTIIAGKDTTVGQVRVIETQVPEGE